MYILFSYSVMLRCWETKPEERPSFSSLKEIMEEMGRQQEVGSLILVAKYILASDYRVTCGKPGCVSFLS